MAVGGGTGVFVGGGTGVFVGGWMISTVGVGGGWVTVGGGGSVGGTVVGGTFVGGTVVGGTVVGGTVLVAALVGTAVAGAAVGGAVAVEAGGRVAVGPEERGVALGAGAEPPVTVKRRGSARATSRFCAL